MCRIYTYDSFGIFVTCMVYTYKCIPYTYMCNCVHNKRVSIRRNASMYTVLEVLDTVYIHGFMYNRLNKRVSIRRKRIYVHSVETPRTPKGKPPMQVLIQGLP